MNINKHIWEGWRVIDFIKEIEPTFDRINNNYNNSGFKCRKELKKWVSSEQPYYKKHIPEVYKYFLNKTAL